MVTTSPVQTAEFNIEVAPGVWVRQIDQSAYGSEQANLAGQNNFNAANPNGVAPSGLTDANIGTYNSLWNSTYAPKYTAMGMTNLSRAKALWDQWLGQYLLSGMSAAQATAKIDTDLTTMFNRLGGGMGTKPPLTTPQSLINTIQPGQINPKTGQVTETPVDTSPNAAAFATASGGTGGAGTSGGGTTWDTMNTDPIDTINAQNITWRNLPPELFTFPFWREGMSGSTTTAGSTPGYNMQQPRYSPELFFPAAQQWGNWTPSERQAYQSAVQGTGASWDDAFEGLKKKWGVFSNTVQPQWAHTGGKFNWTPAGYNR